MTTPKSFDVDLPHGIRLSCRAAGQGPRRVMLLHGFPEAAFSWDGVMSALAGQAHVIAPNQRGYERSSAPAEVSAYRARHLVADAAALVEWFGAPLDLLVAHDWGGAVAWALAAQRPELIKRLLIINAPHPAVFLRELQTHEAQKKASAYMNFLARPDAAELLAQNDYARLWPFLTSMGPAPWLDEEMRKRYREVWAQSLASAARWYAASPLRPATGPDDPIHTLQLPDDSVTVQVPTTVLWGERDTALLPGMLEGLERWVPNLRVVRMADASHWIVHEHPDRVVAEIAALLE